MIRSWEVRDYATNWRFTFCHHKNQQVGDESSNKKLFMN